MIMMLENADIVLHSFPPKQREPYLFALPGMDTRPGNCLDTEACSEVSEWPSFFVPAVLRVNFLCQDKNVTNINLNE
jgi:hypothetical protein